MKKVSVIIPVYNASPYIKECISSVLSQTYKNIEVICINDGSTDDSLNILSKLQKNEDRIKIINQSNKGVSVSRNVGINNSTGEYIIFIDSDDWIDSNTIETCIYEIDKKSLDVILFSYIRETKSRSNKKNIFDKGYVYFNYEDTKILHKRIVGPLGKELARPDYLDSLGTVWGKVYKSNIIKENNITFNNLSEIGTAEDVLFNIRYFNYIKNALYINQYFYHYRRDNTDSITTGYIDDYSFKRKNFFNNINRILNENQLDESYKQALYNRIALSSLEVGLNELKRDNKSKIKQQRITINRYLKSHNYKISINKLEFDYFPIHWKVFYLFSKFEFGLGIYVLLKIIIHIRNLNSKGLFYDKHQWFTK